MFYAIFTWHIPISFPGTPNGAGRRFHASPKLYRSPWLQHQRRSHLISNDANANGNGTQNFSTQDWMCLSNLTIPFIHPFRAPVAEHQSEQTSLSDRRRRLQQRQRRQQQHEQDRSELAQPRVRISIGDFPERGRQPRKHANWYAYERCSRARDDLLCYEHHILN